MDENVTNLIELNPNDFEEFQTRLFKKLRNDGFDCAAFQIKRYNETVQPAFKLPYDQNTIAFVVINTPKMFEQIFLPFVKSQSLEELRDPMDQCMQNYFQKLKDDHEDTNLDTEIIHDFDLFPNRRPKALLQTAAHISGIAYYYQRSDVKNDPWKPSQKIFGVCVHPEFGGWFAIRAILILKNLRCSATIAEREPVDCVKGDEERIKLLEAFNYSWQDSTFRDIIPVKERYSPLQIKYFSTKPKDRFDLLEEIIHIGC